jgi:transcriptional regulator with XRE-family HTH domain
MADDKVSERAYYTGFRDRLRSIRIELDWSQAEMAEALGISLDNYKKYEIRSKFPPHLLEKLALVTHRRIEFIVTGRGPNLRPVAGVGAMRNAVQK